MAGTETSTGGRRSVIAHDRFSLLRYSAVEGESAKLTQKTRSMQDGFTDVDRRPDAESCAAFFPEVPNDLDFPADSRYTRLGREAATSPNDTEVGD
jgi:hypothetical protein